MVEDENVIGAFSDEQAAQITGVSVNQLRQWDAAGFFHPSFSTGRPHIPFGRLYSFRDLVALQVLDDLRNHKKIPLRHLKEVSRKLAHLGDARWTAATLYVLGKRVVFENPVTSLREEVVSGQRVFNIPLRVVIRNTRTRIAAMNERSSEIGQFRQQRFVAQNERVFAGTRIPVAKVLEFWAAGFSIPEIIDEYPTLNPIDVAAAIDDASDNAAA
jgi:DNA-binding transcriptional MerR regulator